MAEGWPDSSARRILSSSQGGSSALKLNGSPKICIALLSGVLLGACQQQSLPSPRNSSLPVAEKVPEIEGQKISEPVAVESTAVAFLRKYCYDTQGDTSSVQALVAAEGLRSVDGADSGYSKAPQRGERQLYRLAGGESASDTMDLVVSSVGPCGVKVNGPAAATLEEEVVTAFKALKVPTPASPSVRAGVFIPYGTQISPVDVRRFGLINTMTSNRSPDAVVVYIPPGQAEEVLRSAGVR